MYLSVCLPSSFPWVLETPLGDGLYDCQKSLSPLAAGHVFGSGSHEYCLLAFLSNTNHCIATSGFKLLNYQS